MGLAGLAFVLVATLTPVNDPGGLALKTPLLCLVCGDIGGADVSVNLLLFLPLALGLRLSGASWTQTVVAACLLSLTVELLQLRIVPGRDASLSDVLTNTTSGAIGATLATFLPGLLTPRPSRALVLLVTGLIAVVLLLAGWGWLMGPEVPRGELLSRWAHRAPGRDVFDGRVEAVRLDGVPMSPNGAPPDSATLRRRLDRGAFTLEADLVAGRPTRDRLWVYMFRVRSGGALTLTQLGRQVGVSLPARALRFRLRHPMVTLAEGFPASAGVPVRIVATESGGRIRLDSRYGGGQRSVELQRSPAFGWVMFLPFELAAGTGARWITGLFLAAAFLPLGYWAARAERPAMVAGTLAAGLGAALGLVPAMLRLPPVHWSEWLASVAGVAAGWALEALAAYLQSRCASPSDSESSSS